MTAHVTWSDEYSLGYSPIDEQHKQLLNLLDALYAAEKTDEPLTNASNVLFKLVVFTETHFAYEEMLLELVGFPRLRKHSLYHEIMKSKTRDIVQDFRKNRSFDREEVLLFPSGLVDKPHSEGGYAIQSFSGGPRPHSSEG